jgi:DNA-binding transcriptional regulator YiaG
MKCTKCREGKLERRVVPSHEIGDLLGLPVILVKAPLLQCPKCGAVHVPGAILDNLIPALAAKVVGVADLTANETRFLRKVIGFTQNELAERMELSRATVARWETDDSLLGGANSLALRALAAMHIMQDKPSLASQLPPLFNAPEAPSPAPRKYQLASPVEECSL